MLLAAAALARALGVIGARFELGSPELVTTKGRSRSLVVAYRGESLIAVDVESSRPLKNIESTLREMDWEVASDWVLSDGDIEYLPEERPESDIGSTPPRQTESTSPVAGAEPTEEVSTSPCRRRDRMRGAASCARQGAALDRGADGRAGSAGALGSGPFSRLECSQLE